MATRSSDPILAEMLEVIEGIEAHTAKKTFQEFQDDWLVRLAVQRALEILSEASRHLPDELLSVAPDIPWKQIKGIGNVLRHEYHKIADEVIWSVVTDRLGPLRVAVEAMQRSLRQA